MKYLKKYKRLIMAMKIMAIFYALLFSASILTSNTTAYYSGVAKVNQTIHSADDWWDGSKLQFPHTDDQVIESCLPTELSVEINNKGLSMLHTVKYDIYHTTDSEDPKNDGEKMAESIIEPIEANHSTSLTYEVTKEGWYIFKVEQSLDDDETQTIWSEKIKVQCEKTSEETSDQKQNKTDADERHEDVINDDKKEHADEEKAKEKEDTHNATNQDSDHVKKDTSGESQEAEDAVNHSEKETMPKSDDTNSESNTQTDKEDEHSDT